MKKFLVFIIICSLIVSCDSESGLPEVEESYSFVQIEYYAVEDSRGSSFYDMPPITFSNNTDGELRYPYSLGGFNDSSHFVTDDWDPFFLKGMEGIKLSVPTYIDENNKIYLGAKEWEYSRQIQYQESGFSAFSNVVILPKTMVTINCRIFLKQYKANYKLFLKGDLTGTIKIIEGTWIGVYFDYPEIDVQGSDL